MKELTFTVGLFLVLVFNAQAAFGSKADCDAHCQSEPQCVKCVRTAIGCGQGYDKYRDFKDGRNWYACRKNAAGRRCDSWCEDEDMTGCSMCSPLVGCGPNYTPIHDENDRNIVYRGPGSNWYPCRARNSEWGRNSERNHTECEEWCAGHAGCAECNTKAACGTGLDKMRDPFKRYHPGRHWYACRDASAACCPVIDLLNVRAVAPGADYGSFNALVGWYYRGDRLQGSCDGESEGPHLVQIIPGIEESMSWSDDGDVLQIEAPSVHIDASREFTIRVSGEDGCPACDAGANSHCASATTRVP